MKRKREEEEEVKKTPQDEIKSSLDGLLIPNIQQLVCLYFDFTPERRRLLTAIWNVTTTAAHIMTFDREVQLDLGVIAMETITPCDIILPKTNREPMMPVSTAKFIKHSGQLDPYNRCLSALSLGDIFIYRQFAAPVTIQDAMNAIFTPGFYWTGTPHKNILWYFTKVAEIYHEDKQDFWSEIFCQLVERKHFKRASKWVKDDMTRLTKLKVSDLPNLLRERGIHIDWLHESFSVFYIGIKKLMNGSSSSSSIVK